MDNMHAIVAMNKNNVIATEKNNLPFKDSEDLNLFKETTNKSIIIMGRKTYEALPLNKKQSTHQLKDRINLVLSKSHFNDSNKFIDVINKDLIFFKDSKYIQEFLRDYEKDIFVIGGAEIYKLFENDVRSLIISRFQNDLKDDESEKIVWDIDYSKFSLFDVLIYKKFDCEIWGRI